MIKSVGIVGGGGAMGGLFAAYMAKAGTRVVAVDVSQAAVDAINRDGFKLEQADGRIETVRFEATTDPAKVGPVDLVLILVKGMHTCAAAKAALPMLGPNTPVLSLQNGWGNVPRIADVVGQERVLAGITVHSATLLGPGHVRHAGAGPCTIGELDGSLSERVEEIAAVLRPATEVHVSQEVVKAIWSKLCLNVACLAACSLLRFYSGEMIKHQPGLDLMKALLQETIDVAKAQGIVLDFDERWEAIVRQLAKAATVRASMLQDAENRRMTEIDTINGAVIDGGKQHGVPTPYNNAMFWLIKCLEGSFKPGYSPTAPLEKLPL